MTVLTFYPSRQQFHDMLDKSMCCSHWPLTSQWTCQSKWSVIRSYRHCIAPPCHLWPHMHHLTPHSCHIWETGGNWWFCCTIGVCSCGVSASSVVTMDLEVNAAEAIETADAVMLNFTFFEHLVGSERLASSSSSHSVLSTMYFLHFFKSSPISLTSHTIT